MSSKVFVTGAEGFSGRYLCAYLKNLGYEVFEATTQNCDICDIKSVKDALKFDPDFVIHLAGISFAPSDAELIFKVNFAGSKNLLDALSEQRKKPKRVILASSASVYGAQEAGVLSENLTPHPLSAYAKSKLQMENLAKDYDLDILITRPFNYTGAGQGVNFLIPKIVSHFKRNASVIKLGNLTPKREYNNVLDVVKIYEKLLNLKTGERIFNIGSGKGYGIGEILDFMREVSGCDITVEQNPAFMRADEPEEITADTARLEANGLNLCKTHIKQTLKWMYENE